ncbi:Peptidyl-prolyl cis-trans isomerase FKBP20-2, chloroplastic [Apostasia shenzhenica]|uniref:Rotamase n=1 Tax=Apostasia shenzhenica TaxID=1088818 RepID=A0A2I0AV66_9ASPA|nr:Peptidyl-prolyl cis-trans isomerase FKBP20-2, chloroplastic [Apostasia shenzhenica]
MPASPSPPPPLLRDVETSDSASSSRPRRRIPYCDRACNTHITQNALAKRYSRRVIILLPSVPLGHLLTYDANAKDKNKNLFDEKRLLEQNKKIQEANNVPKDFPNFIRKGLVYLDIQIGNGDCPKNGQQVTFHYIGYNESGRRIDSTYFQGSPAKIRFEEGIRDMRPGGKRRIVIPPELGPPRCKKKNKMMDKGMGGWSRCTLIPLLPVFAANALVHRHCCTMFKDAVEDVLPILFVNNACYLLPIDSCDLSCDTSYEKDCSSIGADRIQMIASMNLCLGHKGPDRADRSLDLSRACVTMQSTVAGTHHLLPVADQCALDSSLRATHPLLSSAVA